MHLSPGAIKKLMLHQAGMLALRRLARGLRLNYLKSIALIATQILAFIRDGRSVAQLMDMGRKLLGRKQVMPGVPEMVYEVQVEGTFPDGSKLVAVNHPILQEHAEFELILHGTFLPVPALSTFESSGALTFAARSR
jgi:urease subunit gamma/beta